MNFDSKSSYFGVALAALILGVCLPLGILGGAMVNASWANHQAQPPLLLVMFAFLAAVAIFAGVCLFISQRRPMNLTPMGLVLVVLNGSICIPVAVLGFLLFMPEYQNDHHVLTPVFRDLAVVLGVLTVTSAVSYAISQRRQECVSARRF